ncbi:MAG: hypothetical protein KME13_14385, partial [Myxacorys californica WJT36-NPBG1]|nr:hypothetical protein [Myxacorys californica WJT36-NPBG1]
FYLVHLTHNLQWLLSDSITSLLIVNSPSSLAFQLLSFVSQAARTPISTTLLLTKLTGFTPFTPILFASLVGFFLSPKMPLIKSQLQSKPPLAS